LIAVKEPTPGRTALQDIKFYSSIVSNVYVWHCMPVLPHVALSKIADAMLMAITGYGQVHDRKRAMASGCGYYFVRPVDIVRLLHPMAQAGIA
jgi:hypothetical protein